jgi:ABC-2 type transport system ATP-binding protein
MRQRLGLAQAILNSPPVLLLDEPVSALDPEGRRDMLEVIRRLGGSSTVLFSTHILNDVERVCDRVAILDKGRLVTTEPMDELLARYARPMYEIEPETADPAEMSGLERAIRAVRGVTAVDASGSTVRVAVDDDPDVAAALLAAIAACGVPVVRFERQRSTLEDVFLQLVGRSARDAAA